MYVWSSHTARATINRVRLPIIVVSCSGKMNISLFPFAPDNLVLVFFGDECESTQTVLQAMRVLSHHVQLIGHEQPGMVCHSFTLL